MSDPFIGQITMFGGNFAPNGWATCDGQLLSIAQNSALFSILGTTYGGDSQTTFALPDLKGRVPMHFGTGAGLTPRSLGQRGGAETALSTNVPAHNHTFNVPCNTEPSAFVPAIGPNPIQQERRYSGTDHLPRPFLQNLLRASFFRDVRCAR